MLCGRTLEKNNGRVERTLLFSLNRPERDTFIFLRHVCSLKTDSRWESSNVSSLKRLVFLLGSWDWSLVVLEAAAEGSFCFSGCCAKGSKSGPMVCGEPGSLEPVFLFGRNAFHHGVLSVIFDWGKETGTENRKRRMETQIHRTIRVGFLYSGGALTAAVTVPQRVAPVSISRMTQVS
ncbi:hypothetical protein INR49_023651 [Caranx melampygus]|nr:hypothetical protein INR49_023651 [Caranx melampygus]